ncbi:cobalamin-independent methionine synthase II family protein [Luteitalea sp.]|uniref:cobalamin-independent methionine synthase II family protein n=1 Tax=Luteitalea sp. TaxID=2004800 RepID=UPI0037C92563
MIPTEPIGSIPRPDALIAASRAVEDGRTHVDEVRPLVEAAVQDTIARFEATGSPVITDGEQGKFLGFWTYPVQGSGNLGSDGFVLTFDAGHRHDRRMPALTRGPLRYQRYAYEFLDLAARFATRPLKQAVISPSAISLLYPAEDLPGYPREAFIDDLLREHVREVRGCLARGAHTVQVDFTEGRFALKLDPSGALLRSFVELNNLALEQFTAAERARIGVHTCPGGDLDSTHSADVDYALLMPALFELQAGRVFLQLASERDRRAVLASVRENLRPGQQVYVGVIDHLDPEVETPEQVRDRILEAAEYIPLDQLGTTDDCGFSPFSDDRSTSRDTAFAKIRARVEGTALASAALGV